MGGGALFFISLQKRKKTNHALPSSFEFAFLALAAAAAATASRLSVSTRKSSMVRNLDSSKDLSCGGYDFGFEKRKIDFLGGVSSLSLSLFFSLSPVLFLSPILFLSLALSLAKSKSQEKPQNRSW